MYIFSRTSTHGWAPVISFDETGCWVLGTEVPFEEVWAAPEKGRPFVPAAAESPGELGAVRHTWASMLSPLPRLEIPCWAYAMSYPSHKKEVRLKESFRFPKLCSARVMSDAIPFREHLDYEAEIGLLLNKSYSDRFGFFMLNDLTDREIQVLEFTRNKAKRNESFSRAKSFQGALLVGPVIAIAGAADWLRLEITLRVNGQIRQLVRAADCLLDPKGIHRELFAMPSAPEWVIAASGTAEGVLLRVPSFAEKMELLVKSRFSSQLARRLHLKRHTFLQKGDELEMSSSILGYNKSMIVDEAPQIDTTAHP